MGEAIGPHPGDTGAQTQAGREREHTGHERRATGGGARSRGGEQPPVDPDLVGFEVGEQAQRPDPGPEPVDRQTEAFGPEGGEALHGAGVGLQQVDLVEPEGDGRPVEPEVVGDPGQPPGGGTGAQRQVRQVDHVVVGLTDHPPGVAVQEPDHGHQRVEGDHGTDAVQDDVVQDGPTRGDLDDGVRPQLQVARVVPLAGAPVLAVATATARVGRGPGRGHLALVVAGSEGGAPLGTGPGLERVHVEVGLDQQVLHPPVGVRARLGHRDARRQGEVGERRADHHVARPRHQQRTALQGELP